MGICVSKQTRDNVDAFEVEDYRSNVHEGSGGNRVVLGKSKVLEQGHTSEFAHTPIQNAYEEQPYEQQPYEEQPLEQVRSSEFPDMHIQQPLEQVRSSEFPDMHIQSEYEEQSFIPVPVMSDVKETVPSVNNSMEAQINYGILEDRTYNKKVFQKESGDVVFEGRTYNKKVFDPVMNTYVYIEDGNELSRGVDVDSTFNIEKNVAMDGKYRIER